MAKTIDRLSDGTLPASTFPGCYPIAYLLEDGGIICAGCANGKNGSLASTLINTDPQWHIVDQFVIWEGDIEQCDHCNGPIETAYGPVEESRAPEQLDVFHCAADNYLNS